MNPEIRTQYAALIAAYKALSEAGQYVTIACLPDTAEEETAIREEIEAAGLLMGTTLNSSQLYRAVNHKGDFSLHLNRDQRLASARQEKEVKP
jgi:hypothetical protein